MTVNFFPLSTLFDQDSRSLLAGSLGGAIWMSSTPKQVTRGNGYIAIDLNFEIPYP